MLIPFITAKGSGDLSTLNTGLGNVLFQLASVIGIARSIGVSYGFPTLEEFATLLLNRYNFNHKDTIFKKVLEQSSCDNYPLITIAEGNNKCKHYSPDLIAQVKQHCHTHNIIINGYLESHRYFDAIQADIKHLFSPDTTTKEYFYTKYPPLLQATPIAVHCRYNDGSSPAYYKKAIQILKNKAAAPLHFFMFSNDIPRLQNELRDITFENNVTWVKEEFDYQELWLMSLCHHFIIGLSTFGWWGAFLSTHENKNVLYTQEAVHYFEHSSHRLSPHDTKHHYFYPSYECITL